VSSEHQPSSLDAITGALEEAATRLRSGELESDEAAALVERCAQLAADAGAELERQARAASDWPSEPEPPNQERLL
jgi:hypothetical protein